MPAEQGTARHSSASPAGRLRTVTVPFLLMLLVLPVAFLPPPLQAQNPAAQSSLFPVRGAGAHHAGGFFTPEPFQEENPVPRGKKSPLMAVGLSAVLPGAGQAYTENYWKIPVIWGLGGYWIYEWIQNNDRYRDFRDRYSQSVQDFPPYGDERMLSLREFYRDQRDSFTWYLGLLYFLNVVDAYVGAQLYDFDVGPELGSRGSGLSASLRVRF